jgi:predicted metalloprotease
MMMMMIMMMMMMIIIIIIIQFFIYLRGDSTAIGILQSQQGHIQQKQWTAHTQCTKATYKNKNIKQIIMTIIITTTKVKLLFRSEKVKYVRLQRIQQIS